MQNINKPKFIDIHDSTINYNVNQIISNSYEYNELLDQLKTQQKLFDRTPKDEQDELLEISAKINQLENRIKQFKEDVLRLAEQFNRIEINTDRLKRAKAYFDNGEIGEARAVLESELEQMNDELRVLLIKQEDYQTHTLPRLIDKSNEFLILALSTQTNYNNLNWFDDTCNYFESSIKAFPNRYNVFQYAKFLQEHNKLNEAETYYQKYLTDFASDISIDEQAMTLNNLAVLHSDQNNYEEALLEYEEALEIYRELAKVNPSTYLPYVAGTLNNLANLHSDQNNYEEALLEYEEALEIRKELAKVNPSTYLPDVAMTLNNLANLHQAQNNYEEALLEYEEALEIRRKLAKVNPSTYLPNVAMTLNNLANLHSDQNNYEEALLEYEEALEIYRELAKVNPSTYLPDVATTLINLSLFYLQAVSHREKSISYAVETIKILLPFVEKVPFTQKYFETAMAVLQAWELSKEEIIQLITNSEK
jgi:tetratricopeptide (TPR) repeat protein